MFEYVFFHRILAEQFASKARSLNLETKLIEDVPAWEVHITEAIDGDVERSINQYYDKLLEQDQDMSEAKSINDSDYGAAAVALQLDNGKDIYAQTTQIIMSKVLSVLDLDELNRLVSDIVFAVENPDEKIICKRYRRLK
ncbi:MAG: hypothetical protein L3J53_04450 [Proteobacteria bacterium]|nr:hypothetical protein [Pseudomonadota bacterium]